MKQRNENVRVFFLRLSIVAVQYWYNFRRKVTRGSSCTDRDAIGLVKSGSSRHPIS